MDSNSFKIALTDLYDIYNPSKIKEVDRIILNYNGQEFDALKTVVIKYNFKGHPSYNENANRDEYIHYIIKSYSEGNRVLSKETLKKQSEQEELSKIKEAETEREIKEREKNSILNLGQETKDEIKKEVLQLSEELKNQLQKKIDESTNFINIKIKELSDMEENMALREENLLNYTGQTIVNEIIKDNKKYTKVNIENLNFTESDIQLPSQDILENLSKGSKLILKSSEGRVCGIEVTDVTYDMISYEGEIVKEIILQRI